MSLTTLAAIKTNLGISGSDQDATLTQWLRAASYAIRAYTGRYLGGVISAITAASPAVITSIGHGLEDGDVIVIANGDSGVSVDGSQAVTYVDDDTFSVAVDNSSGSGGSAGTKGTFSRTFTEFYAGSGTPRLCLRERPVQLIASIYEDSGGYWGQGDSAFAAATLLASGTDYSLDKRDSRTDASPSGIVHRIGSTWPAAVEYLGTLAGAEVGGYGNIKVTYTAGYSVLPYDVRRAVEVFVEEMLATSGKGGPLQSESVDYYSYSRMTAEEAAKMLGSAKGLLKRYKEVFV